MIFVAYFFAVVAFAIAVGGRFKTVSDGALDVTSAIFGLVAIGLGVVILMHGGGLATIVGALALVGGLWALLASLGPSSLHVLRVAGAMLVVFAFAIPSLLTLLLPFATGLVGLTLRQEMRRTLL